MTIILIFVKKQMFFCISNSVFRKVKTNFYCVSGCLHSGTVCNEAYVTNKDRYLIVGNFVVCITKKSRTANNKTIEAEGLSLLFEKIGKKLQQVQILL